MKPRKIRYIPLTLVVLLTFLSRAGSPTTHAQQTNRAGLVVGFGDGTVIGRCIVFSESDISGYEMLMRSDLDVAANGGAVCGIEGTGCPASDCFCAVPDYWSYWHLVNGAWRYSESGALLTTVHDGDVEGWNWGAEPPPTLLFHQICSTSTLYLPLVLSIGG
jgi:hypothetical protein